MSGLAEVDDRDTDQLLMFFHEKLVIKTTKNVARFLCGGYRACCALLMMFIGYLENIHRTGNSIVVLHCVDLTQHGQFRITL